MKIILKPDDVTLDIRADLAPAGGDRMPVSPGDETLILYKSGENEYTTEDKRFVIIDPFETEPEYFVHIYKRVNGIPETIAVTDRLIIRETTEDDADSFAQIYEDPEARRFGEEIADGVYIDREWIREYRKNVYELTDIGIWSVILKETGEVIGRAGLMPGTGCGNAAGRGCGNETETVRGEEAETGYLIAAPYRRKGYGREAVKACLEVSGKLGFKKVRAVVAHDNEASLALLKSLGFTREDTVGANEVYVKQNCRNPISGGN